MSFRNLAQFVHVDLPPMTQQDDVELGHLSPTGSKGLTTMENEANSQLKGDEFDDDLDFSSDSDSDPVFSLQGVMSTASCTTLSFK